MSLEYQAFVSLSYLAQQVLYNLRRVEHQSMGGEVRRFTFPLQINALTSWWGK